MDPLENGATVRADPTFSASPDVVLLHQGKAELLDDPFPKLAGRTADLFEGAFPEPFLLTIGKRVTEHGVSVHRRDRVMWHEGGAWVPLPGGLASHTWFLLTPPRLGKRQILVKHDPGYEILEFPAGARTGLRVPHTIQDAPFDVVAVAVLGSTLLVVGRVLFPIDSHGFPMRVGGPTVALRFEGDAREPIVDWMPEPARFALLFDGLATSGDRVFIALHDAGFGRYLAVFDGKAWQLERLPIDEDARDLDIFSAAPDGSLFLSPLDRGTGWDVVRRDPKGHYAGIDLPPKTEFCKLFAESATAAWVTCMFEERRENALFFTRPLAAPPRLRAGKPADTEPTLP